MPNTTVDMIIPVRNGEATIDRAVESALCQPGLTVRVIVVDDGSTDHTREVLDRIAERGNVTRFQTGGVGAAQARNIGLDHAHAEFVSFCDADDWWNDGQLRAITQTMIRCDASVGVAGYENVRSGSRRGHRFWHEAHMNGAQFADACLLDSRVQGFLWNKVYRRDAIGMRRVPTDYRVCEDLLFNLRLGHEMPQMKVVCVPTVAYEYDLRGQSITRGNNDLTAGVLKALENARGLVSEDVLAGARYRFAVGNGFNGGISAQERRCFFSGPAPLGEKVRVGGRALLTHRF